MVCFGVSPYMLCMPCSLPERFSLHSPVLHFLVEASWTSRVALMGWNVILEFPTVWHMNRFYWGCTISTLQGQFVQWCLFHGLTLRKRPPPTGVKIAKIGKRGFWGQKTPISQCPRNARFEPKNPHFSTGLHKENGDFFWLKTPISGTLGNGSWEFFDPETLFSRFWRFWPL